MKVFGHPASTCTRKVLCALAEKGAAFDFVLVDFATREQKSEAHLARQPFGVVPAIDDDGFALYESRAIIRYLDARLPGASLVPADLQQRALMEQWMSVEMSYFSGPAMKAVMAILNAMRSNSAPDQEVVAAGVAAACKALDVVEAGLGDKDYLVGTFSLADICYAPYLGYLEDMGQTAIFEGRPKVKAWWERVRSRPSWQKATGKA